MRVIRPSIVQRGHPDFDVLSRLASELDRRGGGRDRIVAEVPQLIRRAIDEVIDAPRTGRLLLEQTEKTEKTYIGTKIEILIRDFFGLPKGLLDLEIDGMDVDIKNTVGSNWMIPTEAIGKPCILIASDEKKAICQLGLIICHLKYLTKGENKDKKLSIATSNFENILWVLHNQAYPANFWELCNPKIARHIMAGISGNERIVRLFQSIQKQAIHRDVIKTVARQKDYMKRLRKNGGARDTLARQGIAVLSGFYDVTLIKAFDLGRIGPDEFIGFCPVKYSEKERLRNAGHII
jgi:hypothetical protein